jgi:P27 family predicted phage terminase small subunit
MPNSRAPRKRKRRKKKEPGPPSHLKAAGRKLWIDVSSEFALEEHDEVILLSMCETLDRKNSAEAILRKHKSLTYKNRHGELRVHPAVQIVRDCNQMLARLRRELCLSEDDPDEARPPKLAYGG